MSTSLKLLMRLWRVQRARDFSWRKLFIAAYVAFCYVIMVVAIYFGLQQELGHISLPAPAVAITPLLAVALLPADMIMKLLWRRSPVEMDDYLRSRPVEPDAWAAFILFDTAVGFLQWMLPLMMAFVVLLLLPWWSALIVLLLGFAGTLSNALYQNCWRRAPGNQWTLPLAAGYLLWLIVEMVIATLCFGLAGVAAIEGGEGANALPLVPVIAATTAVLFLLDVVQLYVLHRYFARMKNYNEEAVSSATASALSFGQVSVWSIEWVQILRSKRLRVSIIAVAIIFLLNTYTQQATATISQDLGLGVNPMLLFGIGFPSIIIAQWVLGVEANYFPSIWTKPWPLSQLLVRKYYCMCALCVVMAVCILPAVVWMDMRVTTLLATLVFACGVLLLPFMATALYSSRMDLFKSAFFNYQGANKQLNIFSFILFIPMAIYFAAYIILPYRWADLLTAGLGLICLALHKPYIAFIARRWYARRYDIMERWLSE